MQQQAPQTHLHQSPYTKILRPSTTLHSHPQDNNQQITIYFKSYTSKSYKMQLYPQVSMREIKEHIELQMDIPKDKQIVYLNGKNITEYVHLKLENRNIIHVNTVDELCRQDEQIVIKMVVIDAFNVTSQPREYKIHGNQTIESFMSQTIKSITSQPSDNLTIPQERKKYYYLLQSSRLLDRHKTFYEQDISKNSSIIFLITHNQLKTRFVNDTKEEILNDICQLLNFGENEGQKGSQMKRQKEKGRKSEKERAFQIKKYRYQDDIVEDKPITISKPTIIQRNNSSLSNQTNSIDYPASLQSPNFKKKGKFSPSVQQVHEERVITKIKASKPKQQLQKLLNSQEKQHKIFQAREQQVIISSFQENKEKEEQKKTVQVLKTPSVLIPSPMPIKERRQIKLQIQRLFNFGDAAKESENIAPVQPEIIAVQPDIMAVQSDMVVPSDMKEQEKPKSPPTTESIVKVSVDRQKMRLSLGSRPIFLQQFKLQQSNAQSQQ